ncbi:hypothetical protein DCAR_0522340 [Daucus carota subsp. sativus]|uniref:Uncharacterized protein n=1 Tax=Daucus carota subsp. sativus TaxID=79200 RepID=A0A164ZRB8_DAUCS|nr:hypothetical protein DCAR_0522340 [Daucus carota subsp. sativus]
MLTYLCMYRPDPCRSETDLRFGYGLSLFGAGDLDVMVVSDGPICDSGEFTQSEAFQVYSKCTQMKLSGLLLVMGMCLIPASLDYAAGMDDACSEIYEVKKPFKTQFAVKWIHFSWWLKVFVLHLYLFDRNFAYASLIRWNYLKYVPVLPSSSQSASYLSF